MPMDWILGLIGGLMIGCAGAMFLLINGRIMGASGILGGLIDGSGRHNMLERLAFVIGVFALPLLAVRLAGPVDTHATSNVVIMVAGGLLVGLGTRLANGCTSGHGVCGISRLNMRGLIATIIYILAGAVTVAIFRQALGVL